MPSVTVPPSSPRGLPMAMTKSPTRTLEESAISAAVRPSASIFKTARSVFRVSFIIEDVEDYGQYGLDDSDLTVTLDYTAENEDGGEKTGAFVLHISRDLETKQAAEQAEQAQVAREIAAVQEKISDLNFRFSKGDFSRSPYRNAEEAVL